MLQTPHGGIPRTPKDFWGVQAGTCVLFRFCYRRFRSCLFGTDSGLLPGIIVILFYMRKTLSSTSSENSYLLDPAVHGMGPRRTSQNHEILWVWTIFVKSERPRRYDTDMSPELDWYTQKAFRINCTSSGNASPNARRSLLKFQSTVRMLVHRKCPFGAIRAEVDTCARELSETRSRKIGAKIDLSRFSATF